MQNFTADEVKAMGPVKFYELTGFDTSIFDQAAKSGYVDPGSIAFDGKNIVYNADKPAAAVKVDPKTIDNAGIVNPTTRTLTVTKTDGSAPIIFRPVLTDLKVTQEALRYAGLGDQANALTPAVADAQTPGSAPIQSSPGLFLDPTPTIAPAPGRSSLLIGAAVVAAGLVGLSFLPKHDAGAPAPASKPAAPAAAKGAA